MNGGGRTMPKGQADRRRPKDSRTLQPNRHGAPPGHHIERLRHCHGIVLAGSAGHCPKKNPKIIPKGAPLRVWRQYLAGGPDGRSSGRQSCRNWNSTGLTAAFGIRKTTAAAEGIMRRSGKVRYGCLGRPAGSAAHPRNSARRPSRSGPRRCGVAAEASLAISYKVR